MAVLYRKMDVERQHPWVSVSHTPKGGKKQRGRFPVSAYLTTRLPDPEFRKRCGIPDEKTTFTSKRDIERYVEPYVKQDWAKFVEGVGPDPRLPLPKTDESMSISELMDLWWAAKVAKKNLASADKRRKRVEFLRTNWYGKLPVKALELSATHQGFIEFMENRPGRTNKKIQQNSIHKYFNEIIKPMYRWAARGLSPRLLSMDAYPFGASGIHLEKRTQDAEAREARRVEREIDLKIQAALATIGTPLAKRLALFIAVIRDLALRPFEVALLKIGAVDLKDCTITFEAYTTKRGKRRTVPYNPDGELARLLRPFVQFRPKGSYLFAEGGKVEFEGMDVTNEEFETLTEWRTKVAVPIMEEFRATWERAVVLAHGGEITKLSTLCARRGKLPPRFLKIYRKANLRIRDYRHEGSTRMDLARVPESIKKFVMGHSKGIPGIYQHEETKVAKLHLAETAWESENKGTWGEYIAPKLAKGIM